MVDQNSLKSIEDLHRLKTEGIITEEEFEKAKERLLFGRGPAAAFANATVATATGAAPPPPRPAREDYLAWVLLPIKRYADFQGRSSRTEFWLFQLAIAAFVVVAFTIVAASESGALAGLTLALFLIAALGLVVPQLAVQVRRLHDQDRSGWIVLLNLLPYVGALIVLAFMLIEGTRGENRFGADPWAD